MILEEATFERFGYYPSDLKPKSDKRILCACDDCGKVRILKKCYYHVLCRSCVRKGDKNANWKGGKIKRICEICGTEFSVFPSDIKTGEGRFCSKKCMGEWFSKNLKGENSANWKNGASFEPYCPKFNNEFKEYIREKFGRVCFLCQKTEEENGRRLSVHHCNYDKDCLCNDNLTCQFIPLCRSCNSKVNFDREEWEKKIKQKMRNKLTVVYLIFLH